MSLLPRLCLLLALAGLASGCQTAPGAAPAGDVTPNAVTGDAIEVTALDAAPAAAPVVAATQPGARAAAPAATAPGTPVQTPVPVPVPTPGPATTEAAPSAGIETSPPATGAAAPDPSGAAAEAETAPPPPPKSELQIACERKRGTWAATDGGLRICIRPTGDGGKRCTRESQCEGVCLARSQTCAPANPLLGCNEILQDNGTRATLCYE